jgi:hypothetical protein
MTHVKPAALIAALVLSLGSARAACILDLRYEGGEVRWTAVPGADRYQIQESFNDFATSRNFFTRNTDFRVQHRVSYPVNVRYRVTAELTVGAQALEVERTPTVAACTATITIPLDVDPEFRKSTGRAILPVVGSTPGAMGGQFKTSLKLTAGIPGQSGRIVFHPAGRAAMETDPSRPYTFAVPGDTLVFDDVVAEMGQSGIGSLEIVPDAAGDPIVPAIEARLFNDTSIGTFGTNAHPVFPFDYLSVDGLRIVMPDSRFRVNVGFRAITDTSVGVLIFGLDRRLRGNRAFTLPAGWMQMTSIADVAGGPLQPGEFIQLSFGGSVVPFYTITENRTNDPTLIVAPPRATSLNVGRYVD